MPVIEKAPPKSPPSVRAAGPRPLRIGIMLRAVGEYDGAGVYIRKLMDALLDLDRRNEYVLFYAGPGQLGTYADRPNVLEVAVRAPGKLAWDQVAVPRAARRAGLDVLFHHKFSIPLLAPCPTVVQQRGTEYWSFPEYYRAWGDWMNAAYNRWSIPLFCRRAARVLTNSDSLAAELEQLLEIPRSKMATVYAAAEERDAPAVVGRIHPIAPGAVVLRKAPILRPPLLDHRGARGQQGNAELVMEQHIQSGAPSGSRHRDLVPSELAGRPNGNLEHVGPVGVGAQLVRTGIEQDVFVAPVQVEERVHQLSDVDPCPVIFSHRPEHDPDAQGSWSGFPERRRRPGCSFFDYRHQQSLTPAPTWGCDDSHRGLRPRAGL